MSKILYFNPTTLQGEYPNQISLSVEVPEEFHIEKDIEVLDYQTQKEVEGEKIFLKEVYTVVSSEEVIVGYDETLEETDYPYIETVQKVDEEGEKLYLEKIYDEESGEAIDTFVTTKSHSEKGEENEPIIIEQQKLSEGGNPIYLKPIIEVREEKEFDHYEEVTEDTGIPCMVDINKTIRVSFSNSPESFSINEVVEKLYLECLNTTSYENLIADLFLDTEGIDLSKSSANTGVGIVSIPPKGNVVTKSIELAEEGQSFHLAHELPKGITLYLNTKKVVNQDVKLAQPTSKVTLKFTNNSDKYIDLKPYVIYY